MVDDDAPQPERQVRLRGGPFDGKVVWWTGGAVLDVPTADQKKIWNPADPERPRDAVLSSLRYRRSDDDPSIFDYAGD